MGNQNAHACLMMVVACICVAGCGLSQNFKRLRLQDTTDTITMAVGEPQAVIGDDSLQLWMWCQSNGLSSSEVAFARLVDGRLDSLEHVTIIHDGDCRMFLKAVGCRLANVDRASFFECTWFDGERFE